MKKLIIILSILILAVSSVCAAETLRLQSVVESKNPTFVLKAGLSPDSFDEAVSDAESAGTLGYETIEKSIQKENIVVYFQIAQKGTAKRNGKGFSLSIEASEMVRGLNEDGTALAPDAEIHKTAKGTISDVTPMNSERTNVAVTLSDSLEKDAVSLVAEYKGRVEDGTPIATFTVTWPKDINAPDGIYQASVILRVSPL